VRPLTGWLTGAAFTEGPVFRCLWLPPAPPDGLPPLPRLATQPLTPRSIARIVHDARRRRLEFVGHSLERGALATGIEQKAHAAQLRRLGRHKSFEYLEFGDLFERHPLRDVP
jgi:hypothetical protein